MTTRIGHLIIQPDGTRRRLSPLVDDAHYDALPCAICPRHGTGQPPAVTDHCPRVVACAAASEDEIGELCDRLDAYKGP